MPHEGEEGCGGVREGRGRRQLAMGFPGKRQAAASLIPIGSGERESGGISGGSGVSVPRVRWGVGVKEVRGADGPVGWPAGPFGPVGLGVFPWIYLFCLLFFSYFSFYKFILF